MDAKQFLSTFGNTITQWDVPSVARMAHEQGYTFSTDELETAADELWGHLNEDQLRDIVGGGGNGRDGKGPVTPNTSTAGNTANGGPWAPPPGDVSGNSCFFTKR